MSPPLIQTVIQLSSLDLLGDVAMLNKNTDPAPQNASEEFLFDEGDIKISKLRFIVGNQTYAMSGITSVKSESVSPNIAFPLLLFLLGLLVLALEASPLIAGVLIGCGVILLLTRYGKHSVTLGTSGGEIQSYVSRDKSFIQKVVAALNDAIILRG